jgi:hypothetical protein
MENQRIITSMITLLRLLASFVADLFKSRRRLEAEVLYLRHQLNIALRCTSSDHFGRFGRRFKRASGSSGLKVHAAIAC